MILVLTGLFIVKVNIETVGVEVNHLGQIFPGNVTDLDNLMFGNGYKFLGMAKIDKFYTKKKTKKTKNKKQKEEMKNVLL